MQTITEKTVREIALENPSSIRVFESFGIDYCCGGKKRLGDACSSANVDIDQVVELLASGRLDPQTPEAKEWREKPLHELIGHIVAKHHRYVREESLRIQGLLTKVAARHGQTHPEIARIGELFAATVQELSTHMLKEEQVLFPHIDRMEQALRADLPVPVAFFGTVRRPIANMVADHDDAGAMLAQIRDLSSGYNAPAGACPTFVALYSGLEAFERDLHYHVHLENNILFPRAIEMEQAH
jgi:regulator of cell morphogenesis and NO signaling